MLIESTEGLHAQMEAAFAIELASSCVLPMMVRMYGREQIYQSWALGYVQGASDALQRVTEIQKGNA